MGRNAFVDTTTKRLTLKGEWEGQWVDVKEHLGVAEQQKINGSGFTSVKQAAPGKSAEEVEAGLDLGNMYMTQLRVYIVGWSFTDNKGQAVAVTSAAIDKLDPDCADEISARLREFLEERKAAREENPTGATRSELSSAS